MVQVRGVWGARLLVKGKWSASLQGEPTLGYRVSAQRMGAVLAGYGAAFPCGAGRGRGDGFGRRMDGAVYVIYTSRVSTVVGLIQIEVGLFGFRAVNTSMPLGVVWAVSAMDCHAYGRLVASGGSAGNQSPACSQLVLAGVSNTSCVEAVRQLVHRSLCLWTMRYA
jgi:hypothetical protein